MIPLCRIHQRSILICLNSQFSEMSLIDENGEIIEGGYSEAHRNVRISTKSIMPDMVAIAISDLIKSKAETVYHSMGSPVRKNETRKIMVFCCIMFAYAELNIVCSPRELLRLVGLPDVTISTYVKQFSMNQIGYHPPQRFHTVAEHAAFLMEKMEVVQVIRELIMNLARKYQSILEDQQPDLAAMALISYVYKKYDPQNFLTFMEKLTTYVVIPNKSSFRKMETLIESL
jgi:hypothetical protein